MGETNTEDSKVQAHPALPGPLLHHSLLGECRRGNSGTHRNCLFTYRPSLHSVPVPVLAELTSAMEKNFSWGAWLGLLFSPAAKGETGPG